MEPRVWVVCGGGAQEPDTHEHGRARVNALVPAGGAGAQQRLIEAEAWAYLAVRSVLGLPLTYPDTTGWRPLTGGVHVKRPRSLQQVADGLLEPHVMRASFLSTLSGVSVGLW